MPTPLRVLIIEDSDDELQLLLRQLRNGGYDPQYKRIETCTGMLSALDEQAWDVIICDCTLSHFDALAALQIVQQSGRDIPFIVVSGQIIEDTAVAVMKAGANDYLMKDRLARLPVAVQKEIRAAKGRLDHRNTSQQLQATFVKMDLTVRAAGAGAWEWDLATGSVTGSPKMFELLGLDPTTSVASVEAWRSVLHADDTTRPEQDAKRVLAEHTLLSEDYRVILPDGKIRWVNLVGEGLYDDQGRAIVMVGLCWDITARKQLEQGIRKRAKELQAFYHLSEISAAPSLGLDQLYQEMATVLPSSWQYPEVACARIVVDDREFCSSNFAETPWRQTSPITVDGRVVGRIEVGYLTQTPPADDGPFFREEGQLIRAIAERIGHLTSRRRAEAALKESEAKYRTVVENVFEGVIVFSEGNKRFCNPRYLEIVGYSAEDFARLEFMAAVHPEDRGPICRELETLMRTGVASAGFQCRVITKHGDTKWIEAKGAPIEWEGQSSVIVFADDITERREIQRRLQESEERYRRLFEATPDGIAHIGLDGRIVQANSAQARMFGYDSPADLSGVHATQLVAPSSRDRSAQIMARRLSGEELAPVQYELVRRDGSSFFGEISAALLCDARGAVSGYTCLTHDMSARLELQAQLLQAQKMEAIGSLAGGVAHDFNNLLSVILSNTSFAMDDVRGNESLKGDLVQVKKAAERAVALTRQLLAFSRKQVLQPLPLDLNQITTGIEKMLRRILGEDVELTLRLAPDLGLTLADPSQIEQVIMNLVVNARDAMPNGGKLMIETANVTVDDGYADQHLSVQPGLYVQLTVTDTGTGMDEQTRARIFEPFFTTNEVGKGTGLGLSTVYGIVRQSEGDICVYSEVGYGTTFKVYLPRELTATVAMSARPQQPSVRSTGTETILVVEDEAALRRVAKRALDAAGYRALVAANGDEALLIFERHGRDIPLLVTDVVMPRMSGRMLAEHLKGVRPALKVLYMSGYTNDAIDRQGILEPGTQFLAKPFTGVDLTRKVREVLDCDVINVDVLFEKMPRLTVDANAELAEQPCMLEELRSLSGDVLTKLQTAVIAARYDDMLDLIETIRTTAPAAAASLRGMAARYDYDGVRSLLSSAKVDNHDG